MGRGTPGLAATVGTVLLAALTGCEHRNADGLCVAPLMTFGGERLSIDEARSCGDDTATNFADYQCQGLTVIECFGAYGGNAYYFDSDGTLVAVRAAADSYQYCAAWGDTGTTDVWFGDVPPEACR